MCRSHADGGRRCSTANATRVWRTSVTERLARNRRVAAAADGDRAEHLRSLVERDDALLVRIRQAVSLYGEHVSAHHVPLPPAVEEVVEGLRSRGLRAVLVGGSVRDSFSGTEPKDLDFEVYGASSVDEVAAGCREHGQVDEVGKAFGVLKMRLADGSDLDVSVPRRDSKVGAGHRGFAVEVDPTLSVEEAAARRDFTVNAISYDSMLGVLIDPHGGQEDLKGRRLRHVSPAFAEDPLRVLRGAQFASRYDMTMDPDTTDMCRSLRAEAADLPVERVRVEWGKFYAKGGAPARGLAVLRDTGWDAEHPGLAAVNDEGLAVESQRMSAVLDRDGLRGDARVVPMAAVLVRRMGDDDAHAFLDRTVEGVKAQRTAYALSRAGALPADAAGAREAAWEGPVSVRERARLAEAAGRTVEARRAVEAAEAAGVADGPEADLLDGRAVMSVAGGRKPGPWMGALLGRARVAQARGVFRDRSGAVVWLDAEIAALA